MKEYEREITVLVNKYTDGLITERELKDKTKIILEKTNLNHEEITILLAGLKGRVESIEDILVSK